jgi:hypothetical protein
MTTTTTIRNVCVCSTLAALHYQYIVRPDERTRRRVDTTGLSFFPFGPTNDDATTALVALRHPTATIHHSSPPQRFAS